MEKVKHGIELSFKKLNDGTCDVFADIFPYHEGEIHLTADRVKFVPCKLFTQDREDNILFNISYEILEEFAKDVLRK